MIFLRQSLLQLPAAQQQATGKSPTYTQELVLYEKAWMAEVKGCPPTVISCFPNATRVECTKGASVSFFHTAICSVPSIYGWWLPRILERHTRLLCPGSLHQLGTNSPCGQQTSSHSRLLGETGPFSISCHRTPPPHPMKCEDHHCYSPRPQWGGYLQPQMTNQIVLLAWKWMSEDVHLIPIVCLYPGH